jgi:hypothetical protein
MEILLFKNTVSKKNADRFTSKFEMAQERIRHGNRIYPVKKTKLKRLKKLE